MCLKMIRKSFKFFTNINNSNNKRKIRETKKIKTEAKLEQYQCQSNFLLLFDVKD